MFIENRTFPHCNEDNDVEKTVKLRIENPNSKKDIDKLYLKNWDSG